MSAAIHTMPNLACLLWRDTWNSHVQMPEIGGSLWQGDFTGIVFLCISKGIELKTLEARSQWLLPHVPRGPRIAFLRTNSR